MVVYHLGWDLSAYRLISVDVTVDPVWKAFARAIASTFLALVGINLVLAARNGFRPGPYFRRLAVIVLAAAVVSLGTYWFMPDAFVFFGILHSIAVASVLALPFLRAPTWVCIVGAAFFLIGPTFLTSDIFNAPEWYWLGLSSIPPVSVDYVPVFPSFGVVLAGIVIGRSILEHRNQPLWAWKANGPIPHFLTVAGRWSLAIYLVHQPILIGIVTVVAPMLGPSQAALADQLTREYDNSCALTGYDEASCAAYSSCILSRLIDEDGLLQAANRHSLTASQVTLWEITVAECRAKTLPPDIAEGI